MITVTSTDKNAAITIDIVKGNWKNINRSGKTTNGFYKESFDIAGQFGIIIHSDKPTTPFYMAVLTSGEIIPSSIKPFYPASEYKKYKKNASKNSLNIKDNPSKNNSSLLYITIIVLGVIAVLLLLLVLRKKSEKHSLY